MGPKVSIITLIPLWDIVSPDEYRFHFLIKVFYDSLIFFYICYSGV